MVLPPNGTPTCLAPTRPSTAASSIAPARTGRRRRRGRPRWLRTPRPSPRGRSRGADVRIKGETGRPPTARRLRPCAVRARAGTDGAYGQARRRERQLRLTMRGGARMVYEASARVDLARCRPRSAAGLDVQSSRRSARPLHLATKNSPCSQSSSRRRRAMHTAQRTQRLPKISRPNSRRS